MSKTSRAIIVRCAFYLLAALLVTALWQNVTNFQPKNWFQPTTASLSSFQKSEVSAYLGMNHLITTLTTGVLAGMGYILTSGAKVNRSSGTKWLALGTALCAAVSLFLGFLAYEVLMGQMDDGYIDLNLPLFYLPSLAHFFSFLLAVVLFGDFAFHVFFSGDRHESTSHTPGH